MNPKIHSSADRELRPQSPQAPGVLRDLRDLVTRHRELTWAMTKRDISDRYADQALGTLWAIGHPLALMAIYVFVFSFVLRVRLGGTHEMPLDYTVYILSGLIPWMAFQESMTKATGVITTNASLVKQVVFPLEVLPVKTVVAVLVSPAVATLVLMAYVLVTHGSLPWTYALLPGLVVFQVAAMIGVAYALSAVAVYIRDLKDVVTVFSIAGLYIMPVFYLPTWVPKLFMPIIYANPFSYMTWCYQDVLYFGRFEHPIAWFVFPVTALVSLFGGYAVFRRLRLYFGNLL